MCGIFTWFLLWNNGYTMRTHAGWQTWFFSFLLFFLYSFWREHNIIKIHNNIRQTGIFHLIFLDIPTFSLNVRISENIMWNTKSIPLNIVMNLNNITRRSEWEEWYLKCYIHFRVIFKGLIWRRVIVENCFQNFTHALIKLFEFVWNFVFPTMTPPLKFLHFKLLLDFVGPSKEWPILTWALGVSTICIPLAYAWFTKGPSWVFYIGTRSDIFGRSFDTCVCVCVRVKLEGNTRAARVTTYVRGFHTHFTRPFQPNECIKFKRIHYAKAHLLVNATFKKGNC